MFHSIYLHPALNLAALAEVRAAEAAAKAEEAEYLAYQAALQEERAFYSQRIPPFWYQPSPVYCAGRCSTHSCGCIYEAQAPVSSAYSQPVLGQPTGSSYSRPLPAHHYGSRHTFHPHGHQQIPAALLHPALVEKELKAKLREETIARHRAEQELRRKEAELATRQRQLAAMAGRNPTRGNGSPQCWPFVGLPRATSHQPPLQHVPQPRPSKPTPKSADDADFVQKMLLASLYGAGALADGQTTGTESPLPKEVNEAPKPNPSTGHQKSSRGDSLIEQLKARYTNEGHDEVRDTLKAVINSLSDKRPSEKQEANVAAGTSRSALDSLPNEPYADFIRATINTLSSKPPSQTRAVASSSTKGKAKDTTSSSDSVDLKAALERVESIEHTFHHLEAEFELPSQLDFIAAPLRFGDDASSVFPHLAFTARNHPVRYYEQTLTTLLSQLDLIESHGDASLRQRRKDAVSSIEKALDDLERDVASLRKARVSAEEQESRQQEQSPFSVTAPTSSELSETSAIQHPQPVRIPIIDVGAKAGFTTQDTDGEKGSEDLVALTQLAANFQQPTPATEEDEEILEEVVEPSPISAPAEPAPETLTLSNEDDLARPVAGNSPIQSITEEEEQEVVRGHGALDISEVPPKDSNPAIVQETTSIENSIPLSNPSFAPDSQEGDDKDGTSAENTFLLAMPESPKVKYKRASLEEDLGSDWSDLDA